MLPVGPACQHPLEKAWFKAVWTNTEPGEGQNRLRRPDNEPQENTGSERKLLILIQPYWPH